MNLQQRGFTIVEFMIAMTLSMVVVAALTAAFIGNSKSRAVIERANQQIESARYAMEAIKDDLELAGYWSHFNIRNAGLGVPATLPNPCATDVADLIAALPVNIQGYDGGAALTCIADRKANSDIVVVRRVATCVAGTTDCGLVTGAPYFQASLCNAGTELGAVSSAEHFRLDTDLGELDRTQRDCVTAAERRRFLTHIYFIANNDQNGDGIPTLKRAELGAGSFSTSSIAHGIESLQFSYGIDTNGDGNPEVFNANPSAYNSCAGAACVQNWVDVMSVKVFLLAREAEQSTGHKDTKTYRLGQAADDSIITFGPFNDAFKRHVYQSVIRLQNPAVRRE